MDDHPTPAGAEQGNRITRSQAFEAAAVHVVEGLARQDARSPRDAAVASLGPDATEQQIATWIALYRPDDPEEGVAPATTT